VIGGRLVGELPLRDQALVRRLRVGRIDQLEVRILAELGREQRLGRFVGEVDAEPDPLDLGEVPDQAEQREVRRR
jgi:hypothetical protein